MLRGFGHVASEASAIPSAGLSGLLAADARDDLREQFLVTNTRIRGLFDRLTELRDRELFDAWSSRAWALKEEMQVIEAALAENEAGRDIVEEIKLENCLPETFRGGILAKLERLSFTDYQGKV